ncbi:hypothetical protein IMZ31_19990 (plasmid) [Pontibacillus sp. ALD_SL1]|uniref:hypothetical protein n=1 Tax=Pontibacillus sp. ALD_SL1 TaxID=2777185 RepID=UPI001A96BB60|nr:hypothetical protein [Pontibacillus sp. ALD_SL1]QST02833.1 hypothetical protein IMZ31_19990 [Pontibacillus sp. ALD_SL1]
MNKLYRLNIRLVNGDRVEVLVEEGELRVLLTKIRGPFITFVATHNPDFNSFSLSESQIIRIDYELSEVTPFHQGLVYQIFE